METRKEGASRRATGLGLAFLVLGSCWSLGPGLPEDGGRAESEGVADDPGGAGSLSDEAETSWPDTFRRIQENQRYGELELAPQDGLEPLGPDPASGLEEFAVTCTGELPRRAPDGTLPITPSSALILVLLPAGSFESEGEDGDSSEKSVHVPAFFLSRTEVTNAVFARFLEAEADQEPPPSRDHGDTDEALRPAVGVDPQDLRAFCGWAGLELPSEDQWEYACHAATQAGYRLGPGDVEHHENTPGFRPARRLVGD
jgi:formylglycine-generating enzyme required for sulfatase activity